MYLDGVLVGSAIALRPTTASHRSAGALGLGIGGDVFDDGAGAFAGLMDDVRYYIRVLNDREVRTLAGVARLDHAVAAGDSVSVPFYGEEPGAHGTGLSLTSMGRLTDAQGRTTAFVWRVRNGSGESQAVAVQNANGRSTRSLVVPPHSDTFLATDGLKQPLLHQLRLGQRVLATAFPSDTDFRDDRIVQLE